MDATFTPSTSVNAWVAVRTSPSVGVVLLINTVPVAAWFETGAGVLIVVSLNCSFSMFHSVSMPSAAPLLSTVTLPFRWGVMV